MIEIFAYAALTLVIGFILLVAWASLTFTIDFKITEDEDEEW